MWLSDRLGPPPRPRHGALDPAWSPSAPSPTLRLPLRELPDVDPPQVGVETRYVGASGAVIETRITKRDREAPGGRRGHPDHLSRAAARV